MPVKETDFTTGSDVLTSDGEKYGTVRDKAETYLLVRVPHDSLTDVDAYIPGELVARVEGETVHLNASKQDLEGMDLSAPPRLD